MEENNNDAVKSTNIIHVFIYTILVIGLGVSVFYNLGSKEESMPQKEEKVCKVVEDLPADVQGKYVEKSKLTDLQQSNDKMRQEKEEMGRELALLKSSALKEKEEIKKQAKITKNAKKVKDFAKCYDMEEGSYYISSRCRKNITDYVDKHKNAKYFEIIPLVDTMEFKLFNRLENNKFIYKNLETKQSSINKLKLFAQRGLAKQRAIEASWVIKAYTKRKALTYTVHYELISKEGSRGIVVRAYE